MPASFAEYRLPPGRHGLPFEQVTASQRWRLLGACAEVLRERGYGATSVSRVTKVAAVSKGSFYRQFESLPACIHATYELTARSALDVLAEACANSPDADPATARGVTALVEFLQAEPALAHVLTDPALDDLPQVRAARAEFTARCADLLSSAPGRGGKAPANRRAWRLVGGLQGWFSLRLGAEETIDCSSALSRILAL